MKVACSEAIYRTVDRSLQVLGGTGVTASRLARVLAATLEPVRGDAAACVRLAIDALVAQAEMKHTDVARVEEQSISATLRSLDALLAGDVLGFSGD